MAKTDWQRLVEEQQVSGETIASFCEQRGINRATFSIKKSELKRAHKFVAVGGSRTIEVTLQSGAVIKCDVSDLSTVLKALSR